MPNRLQVAVAALVLCAGAGCQKSPLVGTWVVDVEPTASERTAFLESTLRLDGPERSELLARLRSQTRAELEREFGAATLDLGRDHRYRFTRSVHRRPVVEEGTWDDGPKRTVAGAAVLRVLRFDGQAAPEGRPAAVPGALDDRTRALDTADGTPDRLRLRMNRPLLGGTPSTLVIHLRRQR